MNEIRYGITPVPKPRMTRRDRWSKRPVVLRYFAFKDEVRLNKVKIQAENTHVIFHVPMPESWSKKKKNEMSGKSHKQRPDIDNYLKALLDAVFDDDSHISDIRATKVWAENGFITIKQCESNI